MPAPPAAGRAPGGRMALSGGLWYNLSMKQRGRRGQTMVEYVLAVCALLIVGLAMGYLVVAARHSVFRTERLVSSDYP